MISKKSLVLTLSSLFALLIIFGVFSFVHKENVITYTAPNEPVFLTASFAETDKKDLENWETEILNRKSSVSSARTSYTETIARSALTEYFKAKDANAAMNEDEIAKSIIQKTSTESLERKIEFLEYQISDLKIISDTGKEALKTYGNTVGEVAIKNVYNGTSGNEFEIFTRAMNQNDPVEYENLKPIISNYEKLISDLLKIETPSSLASSHLKVINSLSAIAGSIKEFNVFLTDPLRGIFILAKYGRYGLELQNAMKEIDASMKKNQVNFINTDPGYSIERTANASLPPKQ
ncbi:MAG: hypothetical protein AAB534_03330 [Patescibacteria group bacterium]